MIKECYTQYMHLGNKIELNNFYLVFGELAQLEVFEPMRDFYIYRDDLNKAVFSSCPDSWCPVSL